jgi:plastocyanin
LGVSTEQDVSHRTLIILAAALVLFLSGGGSGAVASAPKTNTLTIEGTAFSPETLTVKAGDSIVWVNKDPFPHTVTSTAGKFDSDQIAPDKSWKYKTSAKGEFPYVCRLHPTMKAMLRVE